MSPQTRTPRKRPPRDTKLARRLTRIAETDSPQALISFAREESLPEARKTAIARLIDLEVLDERARLDPDIGVREAACLRIGALLSNTESSFLESDTRLQVIGQTAHTKVLEYVALNAPQTPMRLAAVARITRNSLLGDIAINDTDERVQLAALRNITEQSTLERVSRMLRHHRDTILPAVEDRTLELGIGTESPAQQQLRREQLCSTLEDLARNDAPEFERQKLNQIDRQWDLLRAGSDAATARRFERAREQLLAAAHKRQESQSAQLRREQAQLLARQTKNALCRMLEDLDATWESRSQPPPDETELGTLIRQAQDQWKDSVELPEAEEQHFSRRFSAARQALLARYHVQQQTEVAQNQAEILCTTLESRLAADAALSSPELETLTQRWEQIKASAQAPLEASMTQRLEDTLGRLRAQSKRRRLAQTEQAQTLNDQLQDAESALAGGELRRALTALKAARAGIAHATTLSVEQKGQLERRLRQCSTKARELQDWRRWGVAHERERLCVALEALVAYDQEPMLLHEQIKGIQTAWRQLGPVETEHDRILRKRFNAAYRQAMKPCRAFFAQQAQLRLSHLEQKQGLCERLEQCLANAVDGTALNTKEADHLLRSTAAEWRRIGQIPKAEYATIQRRYQTAVSSLSEALESAWESIARRKERLIAQAESLADVAEAADAAQQAKKLQHQWTALGPTARQRERKLWKRFQAALAPVFQRRDAAQQEARAMQQDRRRQLAVLCQRLESALADATTLVDGQTIRQVQTEWEALYTGGQADIERRFQRAVAESRRRLRDQAQSAAQRQSQLLRDKGRLCESCEALVDSGHADTAAHETLKTQWAALPELRDTDTERALQMRFTTALGLASGRTVLAAYQTECERNLQTRRALCIQIEVLAGIESPPDAAAERLKYQVERLAQTMGKGAQSADEKPAEMLDRLERHWYTTGFTPAEEFARLRPRFENARDALNKVHRRGR